MNGFRIVLVGCGGMARSWVQYVMKRTDVEIVGVVDINEKAAIDFVQKQKLSCPVFTDLQLAIHAVKANLVLDITIPAAHKQVTITALKAGCDVLGEKPMAASMADAREMAAVAQTEGRQYAIMQNRRYLKGIRALKDLIITDTIGQLGFVNADFFLGPHFGGFRDVMESPLLLDMAIHTFDQARFITGADPVSVYCHEFNPAGSWYAGNAAAICIFEMSDGSVFCYRGSWCAEGAPTSWESSWRITGSKGTAIWDGGEKPYAEVVKMSDQIVFKQEYERVEAKAVYSGQEGHAGCLDEMFEALIAGRDAETVCTDNIKSMAMVFGAIESAASGQKVSIHF